MKRYMIPPVILFVVWVVLSVALGQDYILWIQGITNISITRIVWVLFLLSIFIELLYVFYVEKSNYLLILIFLMGIFLGGSVWLERNSFTDRYYYEENNHQILVVDKTRLVFGKITFYHKDNVLFAKEFASCSQSFGISCDFQIEDDNLILEIRDDGNLHETVVPLPSE